MEGQGRLTTTTLPTHTHITPHTTFQIECDNPMEGLEDGRTDQRVKPPTVKEATDYICSWIEQFKLKDI